VRLAPIVSVEITDYNPASMTWLAAVSGLAVLALTPAPTAAPPLRPGPWHQLGAAVTSRPGKSLHLYRAAQNPQALAFVVKSSSSRPIHVFWASYCQVVSDDVAYEEHQGRLDGVKLVVAYPPVLTGATLCYLWVNASARGAARVTATEFAY
jgi:hypothetical protein